jgi:hypothetical protein
MSRLDYADAATQRAAEDPTFQRPLDPATQRPDVDSAFRPPVNPAPRRADDGGAKADAVLRDAESSHSHGREHALSLTRFTGRETAAVVVAAIMTLGPLFGGYVTNMHS